MDHQSSSPASFGRSWTPIGETSNQLIVYHPPSHAIQVVPHPQTTDSNAQTKESPSHRLPFLSSESFNSKSHNSPSSCALCGRPWTPTITNVDEADEQDISGSNIKDERGESSYFRVLERAHEMSRPSTPPAFPRQPRTSSTPPWDDPQDREGCASPDIPAMGYYKRFFKEEKRLGIGAEGSVFLATHIISGNILGTYAVKKIAVGTSQPYLVKMLREVRLLETLRHPNIIPYYHSWVDETRFSSFGPPILALHVLMMYASAGNLDAFLLSRSHTTSDQQPLSAGDLAATEDIDLLPKAERIKAFKHRRQSGLQGRKTENRGVLLLSVEEILHLFGDIVEGLAFLHSSSILHLDLKCSNVLLHWEDNQVIPKAMLSDFGTSEEMLRGKRDRTGHTGTMEYMAPETIVMDVNGNWRPSDSHADMWSLGMILHKMLFLQLPYQFTDDFTALHSEILKYQGFVATPEIIQTFERRHIPSNILLMLERLLHLAPDQRPSAERIKAALHSRSRRSTGANSRPWTGRTSDEDLSTFNIYKNLKNKYPRPHSPVRSILALPSPPQMGAPLVPPRVTPSLLERSSPTISVSLFCFKILSLQPRVFDIPLPVVAVVLLTALALVDVHRFARPFAVPSLTLLAVHVSVLWWYMGLRE